MTEQNSDRPIPPNSIRIFLPIQLLTIINKRSGEKKQLSATWILKTLVNVLKDEIISDYGEDAFNNLVERYSLTSDVQMRNNEQERKERLEVRKKRLEIQERKLALKERELDIRQTNSDLRTETHEEKQNKQEIEKLKEERLELLREESQLNEGIRDSKEMLLEREQRLMEKGLLTDEITQKVRVVLEQANTRKSEISVQIAQIEARLKALGFSFE